VNKINTSSAKKGANLALVVILIGMLSILVVGFIGSSSAAVSSVANRRKFVQVGYDAKSINQSIVDIMENDVDNAVYAELDKTYVTFNGTLSNDPSKYAEVKYTTDETELPNGGKASTEVTYVERMHSTKMWLDVTLDIKTTAVRNGNESTYSTQFVGKRPLPGNKKNFPTIRRTADYALVSMGNGVFNVNNIDVFGNVYIHDTPFLNGNVNVTSHYDTDGTPVQGDFISLGYGGNTIVLNEGCVVNANILNATERGMQLYGTLNGNLTVPGTLYFYSQESHHNGYAFANYAELQSSLDGIWKIKYNTNVSNPYKRVDGVLKTSTLSGASLAGNITKEWNAETDTEWNEAMDEANKMFTIHGNNAQFQPWNVSGEYSDMYHWFRRYEGTVFTIGDGGWTVKMLDDVNALKHSSGDSTYATLSGGSLDITVNEDNKDVWVELTSTTDIDNIDVQGSGKDTCRVFVYANNCTVNLSGYLCVGDDGFDEIEDDTTYTTRLYVINDRNGGKINIDDSTIFVGTIWSTGNSVKIGEDCDIYGRVVTYGTDGTYKNIRFNLRQEKSRTGDNMPVYPYIDEDDTPIVNVTSGINPYTKVGRFVDGCSDDMKTYDTSKTFYGKE
jgi:hypothetical protein